MHSAGHTLHSAPFPDKQPPLAYGACDAAMTREKDETLCQQVQTICLGAEGCVTTISSAIWSTETLRASKFPSIRNRYHLTQNETENPSLCSQSLVLSSKQVWCVESAS